MTADPARLLSKSAELYGDKTALICGEQRQTYAELWDRSVRLANALRASGVNPGERVALLGDNSFESLEHVTGLAIGGYVRCALYTHDVVDRQLYLLRLTDAAALIVQAKYFTELKARLKEAPHVRVVLILEGSSESEHDYEAALAAASAENGAVTINEDEPHVIRFSAGTTGLPKGIMHTWRGWRDMGTEMALAVRGFDEDDCYLAAGPLPHAAGMFSWPLMTAGAATVVMKSFEPGEFLRLVEKHRATSTVVGPTVIQMVTEHPDATSRDLSSLRVVGYGTAPASEAVLTKAIGVWGNVMYQVYGQSEALPLTVLGPRHHRVDGTSEERAWLRSAGRPTPNATVRILDDDERELPVGEVGEIVGYTPGQMAGIWDDPELTSERLTSDGGVRTRDMGWISSDGFLYLADRKEDTIISGGYNIWPNELENALANHPAVAEAAVVGQPHPKWGETPVAAVVVRSDADITEEELITWTREHVGSVKKVTGVHFVDELPKSPIGKIVRRTVREMVSRQ